MLRVITRRTFRKCGLRHLTQLTRRYAGTGCLAMSLALSACAGESEHAAATVRDSAGVTIVENRAAHWRAGAQWVVESEPMLEIGLLDGPAEYLLSSVTSAVRLSDGTIAVANNGGRALRLYDSEGRYLTSHGGAGDGPGELRSATLAAFRGDSLLAVDISTTRASIFHPREGFIRSFTVPTELGRFSMIGVLGDVAIGWGLWFREPVSIGGDSANIIVLQLDGSGIEAVGRFLKTSKVFGYNTIAAVGPNGFWFGDGDAFEVRHHDLNGALALISRYSWTPVAIPAEALTRLEEQRVSASAGAATMPDAIPEHYPPYIRAMSDSEGNLWVMSPSGGMGTGPTWRVLSPAGRLLGEVEMPSGFVPFQIGRDFVLVRHWDEFHVEYVRLHRLHKGAGG